MTPTGFNLNSRRCNRRKNVAGLPRPQRGRMWPDYRLTINTDVRPLRGRASVAGFIPPVALAAIHIEALRASAFHASTCVLMVGLNAGLLKLKTAVGFSPKSNVLPG